MCITFVLSVICSEDKVEPIYRPTTLNTAVYDFYQRKCIIYIGPASDNIILTEYDLELAICLLLPLAV